MFNYLASFLFGIYIGQEFGNVIPNVKVMFVKLLEQLKIEKSKK